MFKKISTVFILTFLSLSAYANDSEQTLKVKSSGDLLGCPSVSVLDNSGNKVIIVSQSFKLFKTYCIKGHYVSIPSDAPCYQILKQNNSNPQLFEIISKKQISSTTESCDDVMWPLGK